MGGAPGVGGRHKGWGGAPGAAMGPGVQTRRGIDACKVPQGDMVWPDTAAACCGRLRGAMPPQPKPKPKPKPNPNPKPPGR